LSREHRRDTVSPRMSRLSLLLFVTGLAACKADGSAAPQKKAADEPTQLAGVYPERFNCDSIATTAAIGEVLGGAVRKIDSPSSVPPGVPHPCTYEVSSQALEYWTFDFDCREGMKQRADALFAQYTHTSAGLVTKYNELADAGEIRPRDAGPGPRAQPPSRFKVPEGAAEVAVGAKALDHHGQGLIFIDDDAPCYVRVVGPDGIRRLELARLVAKNLTFANAPMTPRPFK
jgi:hypothetical protein